MILRFRDITITIYVAYKIRLKQILDHFHLHSFAASFRIFRMVWSWIQSCPNLIDNPCDNCHRGNDHEYKRALERHARYRNER